MATVSGECGDVDSSGRTGLDWLACGYEYPLGGPAESVVRGWAADGGKPDHRRPFLAGYPVDRIQDVTTEDTEWVGLTDVEFTRLKVAAEQLLKLRTRKNQKPLRDYALFMVLRCTALRVSELLRLTLEQYRGKHFHQICRKGRSITRELFVPARARKALDRYIEDERGRGPGPLFLTKNGNPLERRNVQRALTAIANQADAQLPDEEKVSLHPHALRHTRLREVAEEHRVQYAMELAGHTSSRYIWRYVTPSKAQMESAMDRLG